MARSDGAGPNGLLDFSGRTVVITGTSSGMGAAAERLFLAAGAGVHSLDVAEPSTPDRPGQPRPTARHRCDLGDPQSIDDTAARLPARVDVLVNCAGVPNGGRFTPDDVMRVNWLGLRHLTESLLERMTGGGSVVNVASTAGRGWPDRRHLHQSLMRARSFDQGLTWMAANPEAYGDGYAFSKEAVQFYTMWRSVQLLPLGVRMNSVCPGITDTAIIDDFRRGMGEDVIDHAEAVVGRRARPDEMAPAMLFLADEAASSYLNGVNLNIDRGTGAARLTDQSDPDLIWGAGSAGP